MGAMRRASIALGLLLAAACGEDERPAERPSPAAVPPEDGPVAPDDRAGERERMVADQLTTRGISDPAVLAAMRRVPRHRFVPEGQAGSAYDDRPLPIGEDQTISQPYMVASMTEELRIGAGAKVLEIGTGSGYQAAVLAEVTPEVFTIEIKPGLAARAKETLAALGYESVATRTGDGYYGWEEEAPFDGILVTAAVPHVPPPLVKQLKPGGRMLVPVGRAFETQDLTLVEKDSEGRVSTRSLYPVRFVPLTGSLGK
jgi:protein-L-isoaspartate(D-aspartate) O-methyltransferase